MNNYEKYKFLKDELKAPRFENEDEEIEWFAIQLYGLYNQASRLRQENKQLKEQLDKYENPDDMTLMMMWATDKVKDENKQLQEKIESLESQLDFISEQNKYINKLEQRIDKTVEILNFTCVDDVNTYDKLCERFGLIEKILKGEK